MLIGIILQVVSFNLLLLDEMPNDKEVDKYTVAVDLVSDLPEPARSAMYHLIMNCGLTGLANVNPN